jgi:hypothetical protein
VQHTCDTDLETHDKFGRREEARGGNVGGGDLGGPIDVHLGIPISELVERHGWAKRSASG